MDINDKVFKDLEKFQDAARLLHNTVNSGHDDGVGDEILAMDFINYYGILVEDIEKSFDSIKKDLKSHYKK